jgi:hypothetical protein
MTNTQPGGLTELQHFATFSFAPIIFAWASTPTGEVCRSSLVSDTLTAHGESASPHACYPPPLRAAVQVGELTRQATSRVRVEWRVRARGWHDQMCERTGGPPPVHPPFTRHAETQ